MKELPIFNISTHKLWKRKRLLTRKCWKRVSKDEYLRSWTKGKVATECFDTKYNWNILEPILSVCSSRNQSSIRKITAPKQKAIDIKQLIQFQIDQSQNSISNNSWKDVQEKEGKSFSRLLNMRLVRSHP